MKVVHLSTYDADGGAARAAFRIHESLLSAGHDSSMLVRVKHSGSERVEEIGVANGATAYFADLIQGCHITYNRTAVSSTWFSLGWPGADVANHRLVKEADVVNLHWVCGLVSPAVLRTLAKLGKPMIWTLHDQRAFTGGCHYSAGCHQFETGCKSCPQLTHDPWGLTAANIVDQTESVAAAKPIIVTPSLWLADLAARSVVLRGARREIIPYGMNTQAFRAIGQMEARRRLLLPPDAFLLLCGVDNASEKRKGLGEFFALLSSWGSREENHNSNVGLLCFGEMDCMPELAVPVRKFGRVRSDEELSLIYSAADLFVLPSFEDNFPNTVLESMCCGTPVAAFGAGGVPEMVADGKTGFLVPIGDIQSLGQVLLGCVQQPERARSLRAACRQRVEENFSYARQAGGYGRLYEELTQGKTPGKGAPTGKNVSEELGPALGKILPRLLKHVFDTKYNVIPRPQATTSNADNEERQAKYVARVKRILNAAVEDSEPYAELKAEVEAEIAELEGSAPWTTRATRVVKRSLTALS